MDIKQRINPSTDVAGEEECNVNMAFSEARDNAKGIARRQLQFEMSMSEASSSEMEDSDDN